MTAEPSDSTPESSLAASVTAVFRLQVIAGLTLLVITMAYSLWSDGLSWVELQNRLLASGYGAVLALTATWLSARSVRRASPDTNNGDKALPGRAPVSLVPIFSGLLNKLVIVGGGIGFGLIVLGLNPILVVLSYMVVQLAGASHLMQQQA
ncbi:MAG: hypothetical protein HKN50_11525 [Gammaproteobacteria bacterium]|nr:hypothetical protein [Gammaproteobacteria bacterium]